MPGLGRPPGGSSALSFPEGSVGSLMEFDVTAIRADVTLDVNCCAGCAGAASLPTGVATCRWSTATACCRACCA